MKETVFVRYFSGKQALKIFGVFRDIPVKKQNSAQKSNEFESGSTSLQIVIIISPHFSSPSWVPWKKIVYHYVDYFKLGFVKAILM